MANEVVINVKANTDKAKAGLESMTKAMKKVGIAATIAGAAITALGIASLKSFMSAGDEIHKMSIRTNFSTEALSGLRLAADLSGASIAGLEKGVQRMQRTILDAKEGTLLAVDSLARMGIAVGDLHGLTEEEKFKKLLFGLSSIADHGDMAATALEVFGRAGTSMLPMLTEGAEGFEKLIGKAAELGMEFDQETAQSAADLTDAMTNLKGSIAGVMMVIAVQLAPIITIIINKITGVIASISAWANEHERLTKILVITTAVLGSVLLVGGSLLLVLAAMIAIAPAVGAAFAVMFGPVSLTIAALVLIIGALWIAWKKNFLNIADITYWVFDKVAGYVAKGVDFMVIKINEMINKFNVISKVLFKTTIPPIEEMGDALVALGKNVKDAIKDWVGYGDAVEGAMNRANVWSSPNLNLPSGGGGGGAPLLAAPAAASISSAGGGGGGIGGGGQSMHRDASSEAFHAGIEQLMAMNQHIISGNKAFEIDNFGKATLEYDGHAVDLESDTVSS